MCLPIGNYEWDIIDMFATILTVFAEKATKLKMNGGIVSGFRRRVIELLSKL